MENNKFKKKYPRSVCGRTSFKHWDTLQAYKNDLTLESRQCQLSRPPFLRPLSSKVPQSCARRSCRWNTSTVTSLLLWGCPSPSAALHFPPPPGRSATLPPQPLPWVPPGPGRPPRPRPPSPPARPATRPRGLPSAAPRPGTPGAGPPATPYGRSTRRFPSERRGGGRQEGLLRPPPHFETASNGGATSGLSESASARASGEAVINHRGGPWRTRELERLKDLPSSTRFIREESLPPAMEHGRQRE